MEINRYSCPILMKPDFSLQIFGKNNNTQNFMEIRPLGAELFHADRHDETNSRFSQFCEVAYK